MPSAVHLRIHSTTIECLPCTRDSAGYAAVPSTMGVSRGKHRVERTYIIGSYSAQGIREEV